MALTKKSTPAPETNVDEGAGETVTQNKPSAAERMAAAEAAHAAEQAASTGDAQKSAGTAVATQSSNAVVKATGPMENPLTPLKNAFPVTYDSVRNLFISNGNVMDRTTNKALGDTAVLELLSFQDQWVISPGVDGDEGREYVRYSDDGVTTTQGENCQEYLADLKAGDFPEAKMSQRLVLVGSLQDAGKMPELEDTIVQINLPPTSRGAFNQYQLDQAYKIKKGKVPAEGAQLVKITCEVQTKGKMSWTVAHFSRAGA